MSLLGAKLGANVTGQLPTAGYVQPQLSQVVTTSGDAGHASSRTTEVVYRRELRPVITTGAEVMDQIFRPKQRRGAPAEAAG